MEADNAEALREAWAGKGHPPCPHDVREKEFYLGSDTSAEICVVVWEVILEGKLAMGRTSRRRADRVLAALLALMWDVGPLPLWANPAQDRLAAMSEVERSEALAVFIESGGHSCRTVARTFFQGEDAKGNVFWDVECAGGESYVVVIKNDVPGSTRVMSCRRLRAVAGADCFKKLE